MLFELSCDTFCSHGLWAVRTSRDKAQGQTGHRPVASALKMQGRLEKWVSAGKLRRAREAG